MAQDKYRTHKSSDFAKRRREKSNSLWRDKMRKQKRGWK